MLRPLHFRVAPQSLKAHPAEAEGSSRPSPAASRVPSKGRAGARAQLAPLCPTGTAHTAPGVRGAGVGGASMLPPKLTGLVSPWPSSASPCHCCPGLDYPAEQTPAMRGMCCPCSRRALCPPSCLTATACAHCQG